MVKENLVQKQKFRNFGAAEKSGRLRFLEMAYFLALNSGFLSLLFFYYFEIVNKIEWVLFCSVGNPENGGNFPPPTGKT